MTQLIPGQNIPISSELSYRLDLSLVGWSWGGIGFKQNQSPFHLGQEEGLVISENQLFINFHDIDDDFEKIIVYLSILKTNNASESNSVKASLIELLTERCHASFVVSSENLDQKALILLEVYKRNDKWKIRCIQQGFKDGLSKLFSLYHIKDKPTSDSILSNPAIIPNDTKITNANEDSVISMTWNPIAEEQHHTSRLYVGEHFNVVSSLRIGCFYQLHNGQIGVVQSLGENLTGSFNGVPYIKATRSVNNHFEQLQINTRYQHKLNKYLIYAILLEGHNHWEGLNVKIDFKISNIAPISVYPTTLMVKPIAAVAMIEFSKGSSKLTPIEEYFNNLQEMDQAYGWGLPWRHSDQSNNEED